MSEHQMRILMTSGTGKFVCVDRNWGCEGTKVCPVILDWLAHKWGEYHHITAIEEAQEETSKVQRVEAQREVCALNILNDYTDFFQAR